MVTSRFVEVTDKEISEIKINSVPKNTRDLCKNTKTIKALNGNGCGMGVVGVQLERGLTRGTNSKSCYPGLTIHCHQWRS